MRIADRWFERTRLADGITRLREPHVHPLLRCNIWHVPGRDRDLIVDTGIGVAPVRDAITDLLDKPAIAVATHIHWDHVGGLHEFDERIMHRLEAGRMSPYDEFHTIARADFPDVVLEGLAAMGYPIETEMLIDALPRPDYDPERYRVTPTTPTRAVEEGDVVDLGDRALEVLHLPGHSPGSIGLWDAASGVLFSGDAIYDGPLIDELPDSSIPDYLATMRRLRALPVGVVHAGHEESFGRTRLVALVDAYLALRS